MVSTRLVGTLSRSDTREVDVIAVLSTYAAHMSTPISGPITIPKEDDFVVQGAPVIRELLVQTHGEPVQVEITMPGPVTFTLATTGLLYFSKVGFTGVRIINPSTTDSLVVEVFVGGGA